MIMKLYHIVCRDLFLVQYPFIHEIKLINHIRIIELRSKTQIAR